MKIGYVGLGAMGGALAKWLVADFPVLVWDLNPAAIERVAALGGQPAKSLPQLARDSDIIFLCLPRSSDVEKAIFGEGGLAGGLSEGKLVVDQTSGVAAETKSMARRLETMGVTLIDAPVAGGVPNAVAGTVTIMLSGPDAGQERAMPAFKAMTSRIYRASNSVGDAQSVKTLNNMVNMTFRVATLEFAALGMKLGVPLADLTEAFQSGIAGNFTCRTVLPAILNGRSTGDFALKLMLKDNNQALALGMAENVPMPLSALARSVLQQNINVVGPDANLDDVITFMGDVTGVKLSDSPETGATPVDINIMTAALAACNRAVAYEIMSVAASLGMELPAFGEILNNGSAWSRETESILSELTGTAASQSRTIGDAVKVFRTLERMNVPLGVASVMLGEVRTVYENALLELGPAATIDELAVVYERRCGVKLKV